MRRSSVVSNLESGEPIAIRYGRCADAVGEWIGSLTAEDRAGIKLFAMNTHDAAGLRLARRITT